MGYTTEIHSSVISVQFVFKMASSHSREYKSRKLGLLIVLTPTCSEPRDK